MNDAPYVSLARAALGHAARRLATALAATGRADTVGAEGDVHAVERAVAVYVATYGHEAAGQALRGTVVARVRSALSTDDGAGYPEAVIARVVAIARRAVDRSLAE
jgi:hypothetical protein